MDIYASAKQVINNPVRDRYHRDHPDYICRVYLVFILSVCVCKCFLISRKAQPSSVKKRSFFETVVRLL